MLIISLYFLFYYCLTTMHFVSGKKGALDCILSYLTSFLNYEEQCSLKEHQLGRPEFRPFNSCYWLLTIEFPMGSSFLALTHTFNGFLALTHTLYCRARKLPYPFQFCLAHFPKSLNIFLSKQLFIVIFSINLT